MFFTAGNQALYMQAPRENSHESLPTTVSSNLNLILLISSPELSKVEKSKNFLTAKDASTERPFFTKTLSSTIIFYTSALAALPKEQGKHKGHCTSQHILQYHIYVLFFQKGKACILMYIRQQSSTLDNLI